MTTNIFNKRRLVSLENSSESFSNYYSFAAGSKIVETRDANLRALKGSAHSVNKTELAMTVFADPDTVLGYERFLEIINSFDYIVQCEDVEAKKFLQAQLEANWISLYQGLAIARVTGIAALEKVFKIEDSKIIIEALMPLDSSRIIYELPEQGHQYSVRFSTFNKPFDGEEFNPDNFIIHRHWSVMIDSPYGLGVGGLIAELLQVKAQLLALWQKIVLKYSEPIINITVPEDAPEDEIDEFFECLKVLQNNSRFVLPAGFTFDVHNVSSTGLADIILPFIDRIDRNIMSLLTGESLTGKETSNGSNARDLTARDISLQKGLSFAKELCATINEQFINHLLAYNYPNVKAHLTVSSPENLAELLEMYTKAKQLGLNIDTQWLSEKLGVKLAAPKKTLGQNTL